MEKINHSRRQSGRQRARPRSAGWRKRKRKGTTGRRRRRAQRAKFAS